MKGYTTSVGPISDVAELAVEWTELEQASDCDFFLSWQWIGHWLETFSPACRLIRICCGSQLVGLGIVVEHEEVRHGFVRSRTLRMHQMGDVDKDQVWIEYNNFLTHREHRVGAMKAGVKSLMGLEWDEFILGATREEDANLFAEESGLYRYNLWQAPCYGVCLKSLRKGGRNYLDSLSRNTRYQINRSKRLYEQAGKLELKRAETLIQALRMLEVIGHLHAKRWASDSGFNNPQFVSFHRTLIERLWDNGNIDIWQLSLNGEPLSFLYNFVQRGTVYFYLGAVRETDNAKLKPGLLGHAMTIEHYLNKGIQYYDFMGGDERYKRSLASKSDILYRLSLQREVASLRLERQLRRIKNLFVGASADQFSR